MACPKNTSDFHAVHDLMPPEPFDLRVSMKVETTASNQKFRLEKAVPQGINPQILILNLVEGSEGEAGLAVIGEQEVTYEQQAARGQYSEVTVLCEGNAIAGGPVEEVH